MQFFFFDNNSKYFSVNSSIGLFIRLRLIHAFCPSVTRRVFVVLHPLFLTSKQRVAHKKIHFSVYLQRCFYMPEYTSNFYGKNIMKFNSYKTMLLCFAVMLSISFCFLKISLAAVRRVRKNRSITSYSRMSGVTLESPNTGGVFKIWCV